MKYFSATPTVLKGMSPTPSRIAGSAFTDPELKKLAKLKPEQTSLFTVDQLKALAEFPQDEVDKLVPLTKDELTPLASYSPDELRSLITLVEYSD
jgi:hypothetical protein